MSNPPTPSIHAQDPHPSPPQLPVKANGSSNLPFRHQPSRSLSGNPPLKVLSRISQWAPDRSRFRLPAHLARSLAPQPPSQLHRARHRTTRSPSLPPSPAQGCTAPRSMAPVPMTPVLRLRPCFRLRPCKASSVHSRFRPAPTDSRRPTQTSNILLASSVNSRVLPPAVLATLHVVKATTHGTPHPTHIATVVSRTPSTASRIGSLRNFG